MSDTELLRPAPPLTWRDRWSSARSLVVERPAVVVGGAVGVVVLALLAVVLLRPPSASAPPTELSLPRAGAAGDAGGGSSAGPTTGSATTVPSTLVVHVAGAVVRPGLVRLSSGARVADAIDAAGGLRPDADLDRLNLAMPVADGQRVWVPVVGHDAPPEIVPTGGPGASSAAGGPTAPAIVDLNTAGETELESLPGIGPATAQAILDQRRRVGRFRSVDDLLDVRGIGPAKLNAIRDRVRV